MRTAVIQTGSGNIRFTQTSIMHIQMLYKVASQPAAFCASFKEMEGHDTLYIPTQDTISCQQI
jgi:hypothetical protein